MVIKTLHIKAYLLCSVFLVILAACESPDFNPPQSKSSNDTSVDNPNEPDTDPTDSDFTDTDNPDTQNFQDASPDANPSAPRVTIKSAPDIFTSETNATLAFECDQNNCTFECSMNSPFTDCTSPISYKNLADVQHTFIVRARNAAGATSPDAKHTWTVDTAAPQVTNLTAPPSFTNLKTADITFECNETDCTFECALNENDFESCASPTNYANLPDGTHKVSVRATDLAANTGPIATASWTVDTVKPTVTILTGPKTTSHFSSATFTFQCNEPGCKYECSIDNGATFQNCASPKTYEGLERKPQTFTVRTTDRAANIGLSTPYKWTVTWPKWVQVGVGNTHACGRIDDGTIWCWGENNASVNLLGHPTIKNSAVPIQVESASDWKFIAANGLTSCGIRNNGKLYCWGFVITDPTEPGSVIGPVQGTNWTSISIGSAMHHCGMRGSQLWCWGGNNMGQLGIGDAPTQNAPVRVTTPMAWSQVSVGYTHTCGVDTAGYALCWGSNSHGQVNRTVADTKIKIPRRVTEVTMYDSIWTGEHHTFHSVTGQGPWAVGRNDNGQLGLGHYTEKMYNGANTNMNRLYNITGGTSFSCGIYAKKVYCTGANSSGQLGRGITSTHENTFQLIQAPNTEFTDVDAGSNHACALDTNGNIWCWGGKADKSTPTKLPWPY